MAHNKPGAFVRGAEKTPAATAKKSIQKNPYNFMQSTTKYSYKTANLLRK